MVFGRLFSLNPNKRKDSGWEKFELFLTFGDLDDFVGQEDVSFAELSDIELFIVFINLGSLRGFLVIILLSAEDFLSFNNFRVDKFVPDSVVPFLAQVVPLLIQENGRLLNGNPHSMIVSLFLWIHSKIQPYRPAQFLPELLIIPKLRKVDLVDNLAKICLIRNL